MIRGVAIVLVCDLVFDLHRLCESKKTKVFVPEHPFPHAEVSPCITEVEPHIEIYISQYPYQHLHILKHLHILISMTTIHALMGMWSNCLHGAS